MDEMPLGRLLAISGRLMSARFQAVVESAGMTAAGWVVLQCLDGEDALTQRQIADRCYVQPATMTGVVDTLERDGLVQRERATDDRRVIRLHLTDPGRQALTEARNQVAAQLGPVFDDISREEERVVRRFLARTLKRLEETT